MFVSFLPGHKTWDDSDNRDGLRPAGIVVNLFADGVRIDSRTVTEADDWSWSFTGLPRYEDGAETSYTIGERTVNGYESIVNGYNITNRLIPETTETEETESTGTEETQETESAETEETQETESIETGDEESESASETESVSKNTEETIASGEPSDEDDHENPDGYNPAEDNHTGVLGAIRGGTQGVLGAMRGVLGARIRTGDDSLIMAAAYVVFLAVAVAGIAAVAIRRKRAKKE